MSNIPPEGWEYRPGCGCPFCQQATKKQRDAAAIAEQMPYCGIHDLVYAGMPSCPACVAVHKSKVLDEVLNVLEARIADQDVEIVGLRRQINLQRQVSIDLQRAHNLLVECVLQLCDALGDLLP